MGTRRLVDLLARDVGRLAADRKATQRRATNDQKSVESIHRAGRLPAITGETVNDNQQVIWGEGPEGPKTMALRSWLEAFNPYTSQRLKGKSIPDAISELNSKSGLSVNLSDRIEDHAAEYLEAFVKDCAYAKWGGIVPPLVPTEPIEAGIQAKGLTAPRVTTADIAANIVDEVYFTALDGYEGATGENRYGRMNSLPLSLLTFCVLVLRNGFTVTGESACASPENFDAEIGRKIARENAINKIWPLMGYELKCRLAREAAATEGGAE